MDYQIKANSFIILIINKKPLPNPKPGIFGKTEIKPQMATDFY